MAHAKFSNFQNFVDYVAGSYINLRKEHDINLCLGCFYCAFSQYMHDSQKFLICTSPDNKINKECGDEVVGSRQRACWEESLLAKNWTNLVSMQPCIPLSSFVVVIIYDSFSGSTRNTYILGHFIWSWGSIIFNSHSFGISSLENPRSSCTTTTRTTTRTSS